MTPTPPQPQPKPKPLRFALNLPNKLSLGRLVLCVFFVAALGIEFPFHYTVALAIFVVASLTDWLDGHIARTRNLVTDLGKLLDPLADKILISAAFVGLIDQKDGYGPPMWMVVTIIAREFLITGLRIVAANRGYILAAEKAGKHKTISQMVFVVVALALAASWEFDLPSSPPLDFLDWVHPWLLWIALIITIVSGVIYFWKNRGLFAVDEEDEAPAVPAPAAPSRAEPPVLLQAQAQALRPAFKEWGAVVASLGSGRQILVLRKGGIAEGRSGFTVKHKRFWLLPTRFHQQEEKLVADRLPAGASTVGGGDPVAGVDKVTLSYFADVTHVGYISEWNEKVEQALAPFHPWKAEVIKERFDYVRPGMEPGLHAILVRVHRLKEPKEIAWEKSFDGCKSWVEIPLDWEAPANGSDPVLEESVYRFKVEEIRSALSGVLNNVF
ncbi:MAG TPA: CDP-diacylglycerol--glycerol-3-phosphate 3-phosphatidyltransferase [Candidatus Methylacidiphilales bacterium]